ncbi:MAG: ImmA/IrrE family metallo-endopeptidase, partial [Chloroflexota bacterium]|nr:ImmA/IrrE family metallo-endopeptidase [Chloroflexota bacterium]
HNIHRRLDVDEFRGFALIDDFAPLVFINSADTLAARVFTLGHELAHVWIGKSGISNPTTIGMFLREDSDLNQFCNQVATELLMPTVSFMNEWQEDKTIEENITAMTRLYHVSRTAVLIRAYEHELLPDKAYYLQPERLRQWESQEPNRGGNFWSNFLAGNSRALVHAVLTSAAEGRVSEREAATLLGVTNRKTLRSAQEKFTRRQANSA